MAVAGGMTTAYEFHLERGALHCERTTYPRDRCAKPAEAVAAVLGGGFAVVAGGDMGAFHAAWADAVPLPEWAQDGGKP